MFKQLGITPIKVDLPLRLNHVNCFMSEGESGWTIIDTGLNNAYTTELWNEKISGKEISDLFITHYHPDHFGHSGILQQKTGARVSMSKIDADASREYWSDAYIESISAQFIAAGISVEQAEEMKRHSADFRGFIVPSEKVDHYFIEGEKVPIGNYEYEVIFTPGHSAGMVCFYNAEKNVLLSADHILPRITPNISSWYNNDDNPLKSYMDSLNSMKRLNADFVIPSHGKPFHGANERIDEIIKHHDERLAETMSILVKGKSSVYDVFEQLFKFKLTVHELEFAVGETQAHLEYLRLSGECKREMQNGKWIYFLD